jgi:alpha-glucosidase
MNLFIWISYVYAIFLNICVSPNVTKNQLSPDYPMPWQESKTLSGEIGEYIVMARKTTDGVWLIGAATNESPREIDILLSFLKPGKYEVTIIQDGDNAHYLTNGEVLKVEKKVVKSADKVHVKLAAGGGACLIVQKI